MQNKSSPAVAVSPKPIRTLSRRSPEDEQKLDCALAAFGSAVQAINRKAYAEPKAPPHSGEKHPTRTTRGSLTQYLGDGTYVHWCIVRPMSMAEAEREDKREREVALQVAQRGPVARFFAWLAHAQ
ncbi:hypothetical protein [Polaromonas sp.]|uniref:hypothetical protein n=1 Tax=Polaromonas sp. TaxID=1869339 RepID=UPI0013B980DD|nr:hypothetical protein [Polaromonas sp.]NDP61499.1 hypothetical protein [Polaromonas sp.]